MQKSFEKLVISLNEKRRKENNYVGSGTTPYINQGKGDTLARRAVSLFHQGDGTTSVDLEGDKPNAWQVGKDCLLQLFRIGVLDACAGHMCSVATSDFRGS